MNKTTTAIIVGTLVLTLGATVFIVKKVLGTNIKDSDFYIGEPTPPNLVVIRPTHFARREPQIGSTASFKNASGKIVTYMSGQNVSLQEMIEAAYGNVSGARIIFPPNMPAAKFDYLITTPEKPEEHLQVAIKKKMSYTAHWETRDTEVLVLKVGTPNSKELQVSTSTVRKYRNGRFTHYKIGILIEPLEYNLKQPVLDETGLTNFYDFNWSFAPTNETEINNRLENLGLDLELTNEPVKMLVVEKAQHHLF